MGTLGHPGALSFVHTSPWYESHLSLPIAWLICLCAAVLSWGRWIDWLARTPLMLFAISTAELCSCWHQQASLCLTARLIEWGMRNEEAKEGWNPWCQLSPQQAAPGIDQGSSDLQWWMLLWSPDGGYLGTRWPRKGKRKSERSLSLVMAWWCYHYPQPHIYHLSRASPIKCSNAMVTQVFLGHPISRWGTKWEQRCQVTIQHHTGST